MVSGSGEASPSHQTVAQLWLPQQVPQVLPFHPDLPTLHAHVLPCLPYRPGLGQRQDRGTS